MVSDSTQYTAIIVEPRQQKALEFDSELNYFVNDRWNSVIYHGINHED